MARLISLLLASVTTTDATSSLTVAKVDADVRVPNASFAKKVNRVRDNLNCGRYAGNGHTNGH